MLKIIRNRKYFYSTMFIDIVSLHAVYKMNGLSISTSVFLLHDTKLCRCITNTRDQKWKDKMWKKKFVYIYKYNHSLINEEAGIWLLYGWFSPVSSSCPTVCDYSLGRFVHRPGHLWCAPIGVSFGSCPLPWRSPCRKKKSQAVWITGTLLSVRSSVVSLFSTALLVFLPRRLALV